MPLYVSKRPWCLLKISGSFLQTSPPFEKSPVCFYVRADGITFHQIGHSFFSVHPYILIKTCGQPPANNERVSLHSHFSHTSQAVFKSAFSIFFTERCFKMKGGWKDNTACSFTTGTPINRTFWQLMKGGNIFPLVDEKYSWFCGFVIVWQTTYRKSREPALLRY